jgi:hypothetical protein
LTAGDTKLHTTGFMQHGELSPEVEISAVHVLHIKGCRIDRLRAVSTKSGISLDKTQDHSAILDWIRLARQYCPDLSHQMPPSRKHSTTVSVATGSATFPRTLRPPDFWKNAREVFEKLSIGKLPHVTSSPLFHQAVEAVNVARGIASAGRVFGATDKGYMGLVLPSS